MIVAPAANATAASGSAGGKAILPPQFSAAASKRGLSDKIALPPLSLLDKPGNVRHRSTAEGLLSDGDSPPNNPPGGSAVLRTPAVGGATGVVGGSAQVVGGGTLPFTKKSPSLEATTAKGTASIGAQEHNNDDDNNQDDNNHNDYWLCLRRPRLPASDAAATSATAPPLSCHSRRATTMPMHMTAAMKT